MQYQWLHRCVRTLGAHQRIARIALATLALLLIAGVAVVGWPSLLPQRAVAMGTSDVHLRLAATDGWVNTYGGEAHYILGFVPVPVDAPYDELLPYRGKAQLPTPPIIVEEGQTLYLTLTNLGFTERPDLDDALTIQWRGTPNALRLDASAGVAVASNGKDITYRFTASEPGTYLWHCRLGSVEYAQMGMVGPLIVRPAQNGRDGLRDRLTGNYAYNDGDGSTKYHREFILVLSELDERSHQALPDAQALDGAAFKPDHWLLNGRTYPHTMGPDVDPNLDLPSQPLHSIIEVNSHERVLLRLLNTGYEQHTFQIPGIPLRVVGKDGRLLRGYDGADLSYWTNTLDIEPGETYDVVFTAPPVPQAVRAYVVNRHYSQLPSTDSLLDGLATKIVIYPEGVPPQEAPNQ
ncbi:MAG: multicopper oxidase domain-containing protein [Chloroflexi bacterium]|nr:multicopper oxidase domain-containing protein [Chloroflexota bacterium]